MSKVYIIYEDDHGLIGVANTFQNVIKYLIDTSWIDDSYEVTLIDENELWNSENIVTHFGKDWRNIIINMTEQEFFDAFCAFSIEQLEVYGT